MDYDLDHLDHLYPSLPLWEVCRIYVVQTQPPKHVPHHADHSVSWLDPIGQESVCPQNIYIMNCMICMNCQ